MQKPKNLYTVDDFWELSQNKQQRRIELVNGEVVELPQDETYHEITRRLTRLLTPFVRSKRLGRVATGLGYRRTLDAYNVRIPDVSFISYERTLPFAKKGFIPYMPDLSVIIKTEGMNTKDVGERGIYYLQNGSFLVWMIHPDTATIDVLTRTGRRQFRVIKVKSNGIMEGGDVLPGLKLPVRDIFISEEVSEPAKTV